MNTLLNINNTNGNITKGLSYRQFVNLLNEEYKAGKTYNVFVDSGHFDLFHFYNCLTERELLDCDIEMKGTIIDTINYRGNKFSHSCKRHINKIVKIPNRRFLIEEGKK